MDTKSHKIAGVGVLVALAMVLSYLESLIPISLGIPGIKLGNTICVVSVRWWDSIRSGCLPYCTMWGHLW